MPELYACLHRPPTAHGEITINAELAESAEKNIFSACSAVSALNGRVLVDVAQQFSPRYEQHRDDLLTIDVSGLERLIGSGRVIGEELRREATARGARLHVAIAGTRMAAMLLALARPGLTIVEPGDEVEALAPIAIGIIEKIDVDDRTQSPSLRSHTRASAWQAQSARKNFDPKHSACFACSAFQHWGLKTLGELAALPADDLVARFGRPAMTWQAIARGKDIRPLVPTLDAERFESSLELEWPIEGLEPLSFVLTRLLEPLATRLERRDRGAAVLHVLLRLVTRDPSGNGWEEHARRLELPTPMRDVRTLRTLALLDLESHPPAAAIDRVRLVIDPTPGRVVQHTLFTRAHPTPEQLSTLVARLGALMGQDRFGAPALIDTYRPGAFAMVAFATENKPETRKSEVGSQKSEGVDHAADFGLQTSDFSTVVSALRRCRYPVPARVVVSEGQPVRVTTDRRGFAGGAVTRCAGPWRSSGDWWAGMAGGAGQAGQAGKAGGAGRAGEAGTETLQVRSVPPIPPIQPILPIQPIPPILPLWNRDEWDVALNDGAVYRIFQDRVTDAWFIDAIVD